MGDRRNKFQVTIPSYRMADELREIMKRYEMKESEWFALLARVGKLADTFNITLYDLMSYMPQIGILVSGTINKEGRENEQSEK